MKPWSERSAEERRAIEIAILAAVRKADGIAKRKGA